MKSRIFGLENEYGLMYSPNGKVYLPIEKILNYIFEGILSNSWPSNAFLENGARFYQDTGCHPEYSTPECSDILDLIIYDKAGERLLESCLSNAEVKLLEEGLSGNIHIFKNNTDTLGNTYGCHENYLMRRDVDFWKVTENLIPFFVTRQIYIGTGKVLTVSGKTFFYISQRAQHIQEKTSSSTTSSRSIINTRDEPHADAEKYRRLHIILGDSNMSEYATYLKMGTTALVLSMIEEGYYVKNMELDDPVKSIRDISKDTQLKKKIKLEDGRELTAIEIQREYFEKASEYVNNHDKFDPVSQDILSKWEHVLNKLETEPMELDQEIDWVIKKALMLSYMDKKGCDLDDPRIAMIDLQYHDVNQKKGLYYLLSKKDLTKKIVKEEDIKKAMDKPPQNTRAKIRGEFVKFAKEKNRSFTVDWSYIKLNGYWEETILCIDPFTSTDERLEEIISAGSKY